MTDVSGSPQVSAVLATAQQLVDGLAAFKRAAHSVDAGKAPTERLLYHVVALEAHFAQLVALVDQLVAAESVDPQHA